MEATTIDTARSLWIIYQQMPAAVQDEFRRLIEDEANPGYDNADWLTLSNPTLNELWGSLEEDYWDELYEKQHQKG